MTFAPSSLGPYELREELGSGALAVVYRAVARRDVVGVGGALIRRRDQVAIKVLRGERAVGNEHVERFRREAAQLTRLEHPNVIPLLDVASAGTTHYMVHEYMPGGSLAEVARLWDGRPSPDADAETVLRDEIASDAASPTCVGRADPERLRWLADRFVEAAAGLAYIHEQDIVHRDIKPANVLLDSGGSCRIGDLGLSRGTDDDTLTIDNRPIGTPLYMAPEVVENQLPSKVSDVWSLGATFYELVALRAPVLRSDGRNVLEREPGAPPVPLAERVPDVPPGLAMLIDRCLETAPRLRYADGGDVLAATRAWMERGEPPRAAPLSARFETWCESHKRTVVASVFAVLVVALGFVTVLAIAGDVDASPGTGLEEPIALGDEDGAFRELRRMPQGTVATDWAHARVLLRFRQSANWGDRVVDFLDRTAERHAFLSDQAAVPTGTPHAWLCGAHGLLAALMTRNRAVWEPLVARSRQLASAHARDVSVQCVTAETLAVCDRHFEARELLQLARSEAKRTEDRFAVHATGARCAGYRYRQTLERGLLRDVIDHADACLALRPDDALHRIVKAEAMWHDGGSAEGQLSSRDQVAEPLQLVDDALHVSPDAVHGIRVKGRILTRVEKHATDGIELLSRLRAAGNAEAEDLLFLAYGYHARPDWPRMKEAAQAGLARLEHETMGRRRRLRLESRLHACAAVATLGLGKPDDARTLALRASRADDSLPETWYALYRACVLMLERTATNHKELLDGLDTAARRLAGIQRDDRHGLHVRKRAERLFDQLEEECPSFDPNLRIR